jgi:hypothetical protein
MIFHSYVSLPEGTPKGLDSSDCAQNWSFAKVLIGLWGPQYLLRVRKAHWNKTQYFETASANRGDPHIRSIQIHSAHAWLCLAWDATYSDLSGLQNSGILCKIVWGQPECWSYHATSILLSSSTANFRLSQGTAVYLSTYLASYLNFRELHVYLSQAPCGATMPLVETQSLPEKKLLRTDGCLLYWVCSCV